MAASEASSGLSKKKERKLREATDESIVTPVLQIGDEVPDLKCDATTGMFNLHDLIDGAFSVIVTFRQNEEPVATTEMGMLSKLKDEFAARDIRLVAVSCDSKNNHRKWIEEIQELQDCVVHFPIIADEDAEISRILGLVRPKAVNARMNLRPATSIFVMDIDKRIRIIQQYPATTGRNFYETIRAIDALQLHLYHQVVVPANWKQGDEVFVAPGVSSSAAATMFPKGFNEVKPWYRPTTQPDVE